MALSFFIVLHSDRNEKYPWENMLLSKPKHLDKTLFPLPVAIQSLLMTISVARVFAFGFQGLPVRFRNPSRIPARCSATKAETDERWMRVALDEARAAGRRGEVPIGAVLVNVAGNSLSRARNGVELFTDPTMHAEMRAIRAAATAQGNWRLLGTTLYSTLEPCAMCLSAAALSRVARIVYGALDLRIGACGTWVDLVEAKHPFYRFEEVHGGVLAEESRELMQENASAKAEAFRDARGEG